jgi:hypothetical protein
MLCSLFKFSLVLNSVLQFWKQLVFESLLGISETCVCSVSALQLKIVFLLDAHQLLMLSAGTLIYLIQKLFLSVIFYNNCGTFYVLDINSTQYKFMCIYILFLISHLLLTTLTCVVELLLSSI